MNIILNHKEQSVQSTTLTQLIDEFALETKGVAIAINNKVIARNDWGAAEINEGDKVVIVSAVFGG